MALPSNSSNIHDDLLYWNGNEQAPSEFDEEDVEREVVDVDNKPATTADKGKEKQRESMYVHLFERESGHCLRKTGVGRS
jgi:hypothetical protein